MKYSKIITESQTWFEQLSIDTIGCITKDINGFYSGLTKSLYIISIEIILGDNTIHLPVTEQKQIIIDRFFKLYPYAK